ncbi:substrate-binding domain-containing protein [Facklamia sp. DSM 111018]|uniref:Substrate-binding domain-containing protein n=1 Tax=Facklamia lactis TaxID=2749967 RepID=A0ABS0LQK7_9LACT|nr:substrate-binding domain-containing protein [Facklamia lactis]MBG9986363.1 substrate-binding domain-containing protein [Facklamia lactis]
MKYVNKVVAAMLMMGAILGMITLHVEAQDKYTIGLSMNTQTNPFFVTVTEGVKDAAEELGIELIVTDAQNSPETQLTDIENILAKSPDALIIDPTDSDAIIPAVELANEAGVPVFTMDRQTNGGEVISHIGYDAIKSGKLAGEYLVEQLGGKGKVVELQGIMGTNVAQDRSEGFNSIISENPDMEIVSQQSANFDRAEALTVMENILTANPEINGLYAANDEMLLGAMEAIEAAGRTDEIIVIGCDGLDETLEGIKGGSINATVAEPPYFLGESILKVAYDHLEGKKIEEMVLLDNEVVTQDNVDAHLE